MAAQAKDKVRFVEHVNAVLNYDNPKGSKKGRGKKQIIGQPARETVFIEKTIVTEDGKGNVISRDVVRSDASERIIEQFRNPDVKQVTVERNAKKKKSSVTTPKKRKATKTKSKRKSKSKRK